MRTRRRLLFKVISIAGDRIEQVDGLMGHLEDCLRPRALGIPIQLDKGTVQFWCIADAWPIIRKVRLTNLLR